MSLPVGDVLHSKSMGDKTSQQLAWKSSRRSRNCAASVGCLAVEILARPVELPPCGEAVGKELDVGSHQAQIYLRLPREEQSMGVQAMRLVRFRRGVHTGSDPPMLGERARGIPAI